jgi:hypothetical protein
MAVVMKSTLCWVIALCSSEESQDVREMCHREDGGDVVLQKCQASPYCIPLHLRACSSFLVVVQICRRKTLN